MAKQWPFTPVRRATMHMETLQKVEALERRLRAIRVYCEGVARDFPHSKTWMNNIIEISEGK